MYLKSPSGVRSSDVEELLLGFLALVLYMQGRLGCGPMLVDTQLFLWPYQQEQRGKHPPQACSTRITCTLLLCVNDAVSPLSLVFMNKVWHCWLILGPRQLKAAQLCETACGYLGRNIPVDRNVSAEES